MKQTVWNIVLSAEQRKAIKGIFKHSQKVQEESKKANPVIIGRQPTMLTRI